MNNRRKSAMKPITKSLRRDSIPTRSDILYIVKHFDKMTYKQCQTNAVVQVYLYN
jgi:hypothetical protein